MDLNKLGEALACLHGIEKALTRIANAMEGRADTPMAEPPAPPKAEPPKAEPPAAEPPKAEPPAAEPPAAEPPAAEPPVDPVAAGATPEVVSQTFKEYFQQHGRAAAKALLEQFGASSISAVPHDKWKEFIRAAGRGPQ